MGFRSWNAFFGGFSQTKGVAFAQAFILRKFSINGVPTSLLDLGYNRIGVDDGWEACGSGVNGSFHDATGTPLYNTQLWPNLRNFTDYAHSLGLYVDWYANNDGCCEAGKVPGYYNSDAHTHVVVNGVDGLKFDSCGPAPNMTEWAVALNATGRPVLTENCNNQDPFRPSVWPDGTLDCPYNFFRTSIDNAPAYISAISNMMDTVEFLPISQPGCWAYPDALEIGAPIWPYPDSCSPNKRLNLAQAYASFAGWAVISSPLILSFDMTNETEYDTWWPVVSNPAAIAINQAWAGSAGKLAAQSTQLWSGRVPHGAGCEAPYNRTLPYWTVWSKPLPGGTMAAVAMNTVTSTQTFSVSTVSLGFPPDQLTFGLMDVWTGNTLPGVTGGLWEVTLPVDGHAFVLFTPATGQS